jgi:hypothetical protein
MMHVTASAGIATGNVTERLQILIKRQIDVLQKLNRAGDQLRGDRNQEPGGKPMGPGILGLLDELVEMVDLCAERAGEIEHLIGGRGAEVGCLPPNAISCNTKSGWSPG